MHFSLLFLVIGFLAVVVGVVDDDVIVVVLVVVDAASAAAAVAVVAVAVIVVLAVAIMIVSCACFGFGFLLLGCYRLCVFLSVWVFRLFGCVCWTGLLWTSNPSC